MIVIVPKYMIDRIGLELSAVGRDRIGSIEVEDPQVRAVLSEIAEKLARWGHLHSSRKHPCNRHILRGVGGSNVPLGVHRITREE